MNQTGNDDQITAERIKVLRDVVREAYEILEDQKVRGVRRELNNKRSSELPQLYRPLLEQKRIAGNILKEDKSNRPREPPKTRPKEPGAGSLRV